MEEKAGWRFHTEQYNTLEGREQREIKKCEADVKWMENVRTRSFE